MSVYAVIDTNVIIVALLTKHEDAATLQVFRAVFDGRITPLFHPDIIAEYNEVLRRSKFHLKEQTIQTILKAIVQFGVEVHPAPSGEVIPDMDDLIFYEVALEKQEDDAYLVTGNQIHFPKKPFVVTPAEMMEILNKGMKREEATQET